MCHLWWTDHKVPGRLAVPAGQRLELGECRPGGVSLRWLQSRFAVGCCFFFFFFAHCLPFTICLIWPNELRRFNFELRYDGSGSAATCWSHNCDWNVICQNKFNGLSSRRRNALRSERKTAPRTRSDPIALVGVPQWRACSTRVLISSKQPTRYQGTKGQSPRPSH